MTGLDLLLGGILVFGIIMLIIAIQNDRYENKHQ